MKKAGDSKLENQKTEREFLWELLTDPCLETEESLQDYIDSEKLDIDELTFNIDSIIANAIAKVQLEKGKNLNDYVGQKLKSLLDNITDDDIANFSFAHRKLDKDSTLEGFELSEDDKKILKILKDKAKQKDNPDVSDSE